MDIEDEVIDDFTLWAKNQPSHLSYSRVKKFLRDLLGVNSAKAEIAMAQMQEDDIIKIINLHKSNGRRVFLEPLPAIQIEHIRSSWDGSPRTTQSVDSICAMVHDRTGHSKEDVRSFLNELHTNDLAVVNDDMFRWQSND